MANYDRSILVPYLQDVCSMELLCSRLSREISYKNHEIYQLSSKINQDVSKPSVPIKKNYFSGSFTSYLLVLPFSILPLFFGIRGLMNGAVWLENLATAFFGISWLIDRDGWLGKLIHIALIAFGIYMGFIFIFGTLFSRSKSKDAYKTAVERYHQNCADFQQHQKQLPQWKHQQQEKFQQLLSLEQHQASAEALLKELYDVNIIPSRYRNIHAAYYLYDFFSTSKETDLEKVIQTMLLDEIIQKLDRIIAQNEQILLNQRISIALQTQNNKQMADNHHQQMQAIARMEQNQELQIDYQKMIAENQIVTNFLLAADYLYKD